MVKIDVSVQSNNKSVPFKNKNVRKLLFRPPTEFHETFRNFLKKDVDKYINILDTTAKPTHDDLKETRVNPDDILYFPIYSRDKDAYQVDLTFIKTGMEGKTYINQAILCMVNINTRFAAAWPLDYTLKTKYDIDDEWTPRETRSRNNKKKTDTKIKQPKSMKLLRKVQYKNSTSCLKALMHCLIYLYHFDQKVSKIYSDDGNEFKGEVAEFCRNTDEFFRRHPEQRKNWDDYERDILQEGTKKRFKNKGKAYKMLPTEIPWEMFNPNEGSKRRLGIVERFNRTLKGYIRKNIYNPRTKTFDFNQDWKHLLLVILGLYNQLLNHRTLFETFNEGEHYKPKEGNPVTPFAMTQEQELENGKLIDPEEFYVDKMKDRTKKIWKYYEHHLRFKKFFTKKFARVITKQVANNGKLFKKKYDELPHKGYILNQQGNTFVIGNEEPGPQVLTRRYLPWELSLNKKIGEGIFI
jgi:hypothetical protein